MGIFSVAKKMLKALKMVKNATSIAELDKAAKMLAEAIIMLGVDTFIGLLTRGAGKMKRMGSGKTDGAGAGNTPKTKKEIEAGNKARADEAAGKKAKPKYNEKQLKRAEEEGLDPKWIKEDGEIDWPPNEGFDGPPKTGSLDPPAEFDRYGGYIDNQTGEFKDTGMYTSPVDVPGANRAVTPNTLKKPYTQYKVVKPIPDVKSGKIAPWFDQPGGGIQHKMPMNIDELIKGGYIEPIG